MTETHASNPAQVPVPAHVRLRAKVLGGDLSGGQWRALAQAAEEFTPGVPLHLTTRQDVELHEMRQEQIPAILDILSQAGITAKQACGNTVRNVTVCPCSGVRTGRPDLAPLAWEIRRALESIEGDLTLPRKFKVSLSACDEGCAQPYINDVGLVAMPSGGGWVFRVIVAGSLGARPGLGVVWDERLAVADVVPLSVAALRVFAAHADRKNRATARLRHIRQRMGEEAFATMLREALHEAKRERDWPAVKIATVQDGFDASVVLTFADGNVTSQQARALAELAGRHDLRVRIDNRQRVIVAGKSQAELAKALDKSPVLKESARPQAAIVTCPGRRWCKNAITDTGAMADLLRRELREVLGPENVVTVCGCPNNCAHSAIAPIGLSGGRSGGSDVYTLFTGGGMGQSDLMADRVAEKLTPESAVAEIRKLLAARQK